jgi:hypothetical protein
MTLLTKTVRLEAAYFYKTKFVNEIQKKKKGLKYTEKLENKKE